MVRRVTAIVRRRRTKDLSVAKHGNRMAAMTDIIVKKLMKHGGGIMFITTVMLYSWIWENEYAPQRWRE